MSTNQLFFALTGVAISVVGFFKLYLDSKFETVSAKFETIDAKIQALGTEFKGALREHVLEHHR